MAKAEDSPFRGLILSWPGIVALLVAAWGLIAARPQLESYRPVTSGTRDQPFADGSLPARLWQDPLTVVRDAPRRAGGFSPLVQAMPDLPTQGGEVLFLFVWLNAIFAVWVVLLIVLYATTVYPQRHGRHEPAPSTQPAVPHTVPASEPA